MVDYDATYFQFAANVISHADQSPCFQFEKGLYV